MAGARAGRGPARRGRARQGLAWRGSAWQGLVWLGMARHGWGRVGETEGRPRPYFAALALLVFQSVAADTMHGRVVGIADGDTLTVLDQDRAAHKVRLSGIDAPEKSQPFGSRSKQSLSELAYGRTVSVEWQKRDRYRRVVGKVIEGRRDVNLEQVRLGLAWWYRKYQSEQTIQDRDRYNQTEAEARTAGRGLWEDSKPIPPWEWRRVR